MKEKLLGFSYFKGHGDGLHIACSDDGLNWWPLHDDAVLVKPSVGQEKIMRDPCVVQGVDGKFHLVWTCGWKERGIGYAYSEDLINWSEQSYLPVMEHEPRARNCWAPEIFYYHADQVYIIYWSSTIEGAFPETQPYGDDGYNHRLYYVTTRDFKSFSKTQLLYNGGFNVIDGNIVSDGDRYLLFMKNETLTPPQKNLRMAIGTSPFNFGPAGEALNPGHYWAEGPTARKIQGSWMVYFDKYKINEIGVLRSHDLVTWEDISGQLRFPKGAQHGFIFEASLNLIENSNHTVNLFSKTRKESSHGTGTRF